METVPPCRKILYDRARSEGFVLIHNKKYDTRIVGVRST